MKRFTTLLMIMLTFGLIFAPTIRATQAVDLDDPVSMGIESGYGRMYMHEDLMTMMVTGEGDIPDVLMLMIVGLQFGTVDQVDMVFEPFFCTMVANLAELDTPDAGITCDELEAMAKDEGFEIEIANVDGLGDRSMEATFVLEDDSLGVEMDMTTNILIVQDDTDLFVVVHMGTVEPGVGDAIAAYILKTVPGTATVTLDEDGASTGGFFDRLPPEGDSVLDGFIPVEDVDMGDDLLS